MNVVSFHFPSRLIFQLCDTHTKLGAQSPRNAERGWRLPEKYLQFFRELVVVRCSGVKSRRQETPRTSLICSVKAFETRKEPLCLSWLDRAFQVK